MEKKRTAYKALTFVLVVLLVGSLLIGLLQEARAVNVRFDSPPSSIVTATEFFVNIEIPAGERVPIETLEAIVEQQDPNQPDKLAASLIGRARCTMFASPGYQCPGDAPLTTLGVDPATSIKQIRFVNAYKGSVAPENVIGASLFFSIGDLTATPTGYGYDDVSPQYNTLGYGYGYGYKGAGPDCAEPPCFLGTGYGYGYFEDSPGAEVILRIGVTIDSCQLERDARHYLTVQALTGSSTIGVLSSPFTEFTAAGCVSGGTGGSAGTPTDEVDGTPQDPPPGAQSSHTGTITADQGDRIRINLPGDDDVPWIEILFDQDVTAVGYTINVFPGGSPPPGVDAPPDGVEVWRYVEVILTDPETGEEVHFFGAIPPQDVPDAERGVILRYVEGEWVPVDNAAITDDGGVTLSMTGSSGCCSFFALAFDMEGPSIALDAPSSPWQGLVTLTADASDNLQVDRVEFSVNGQTLRTVSTAPYSWDFDTAAYPDGEHTVTATAYDFTGAASVATQSATIQNADDGDGPTQPGDGDGPDLTWLWVLLALLAVGIVVVAVIVGARMRKGGQGGSS